MTSASLDIRSVVVLNDVAGLPDSTAALLKQFVEQGGGLLVAAGERTRWGGAASALLPGTLGGLVNRPVVQGRFGTVEESAIPSSSSSSSRATAISGRRRSIAIGRSPRRPRTPCWRDSTTARSRWPSGGWAPGESWFSPRAWIRRGICFPRAPVFVPLIQLSFRYLAQYE